MNSSDFFFSFQSQIIQHTCFIILFGLLFLCFFQSSLLRSLLDLESFCFSGFALSVLEGRFSDSVITGTILIITIIDTFRFLLFLFFSLSSPGAP